MVKGPENKKLLELIEQLRKANKGIWKKAADELSRPTRRRPEVNVSKIERYAKDGSVILVPGKVLGSGFITKKVTVAAFSFSGSARSLISKGGGRAIGIHELVAENPQGKDVLILI
ncbi:MAG: 50S ribosomal protein L18e [Candidatus Micrarchaeota archaeon]